MALFTPPTTAALVLRATVVECLVRKGRRVESCTSVPIEGPDDHHVVQAIQKALASTPVAIERLAVSITSHGILFRCFTIPAVPKAELDPAVQFEARKYIPFKITSLLWDYRTMPVPKSNRLNVVFGAIPKELFQKIQELLATAGVHATVIEPISVSLARLVPPAKDRAANEFVCLVDVSGDAAHLAIIKDRVPYLTRDISLATSEGHAPDASPPSGTPAVRAEADARAQRLLSELSVSMDFFLREYPSTTISQVQLCGDEDALGPWCEPLSQQLHCPVGLGRALIQRRLAGEVPLPFAAALGLLESTVGFGGPFNFLKQDTAKEPPQAAQASAVQRVLEAAGLSAAWRTPHLKPYAGTAAVLLLLVWGLGVLQASSQRQQLDHLISAQATTTQRLGTLSQQDLERLKEQTANQVAWLRDVMDERISVAAKLDALARSLPDGVWLTGMTFENPLDERGLNQAKLSLQGSCFLGGETGKELSAIQQFEDQLKRNAAFVRGFGSAQVDRIEAETGPKQRDTYRTFQLNCLPSRRL